MSISLEEVRHVAKLARLDLDEAEMVSLQSELNALLGHFADIQNFDLEETFGHPLEAEAMSSYLNQLQNVWSEDRVRDSFRREDALKNAPVSKAGLFLVPQIIEE